MAQPSFPYLNRKIKCSFPWYRNYSEVTRNTIQCKAESDGCVPFKQWTPRTNLPPFQIFATEAAQYGLAMPQTWGIYDLDGNLVVDLAANLELIQVVQFENPAREYLVYTGSMLSTYLPYGIYESRISIEAGRVFYSETFEVICDGIDVAPCATVSGFRGDEDPIVGEFYLNVGAPTYREYLGPDAGVPETEDFYSSAYQCPSLLVNGTGSFPASYWNGSSWQPLTIIEDEVANCFLRLKWTSCGNVGTLYYQDGFQNVLYLDPHTFVVRQSPELKLDNDEGGKGQQNTTFTRKEVKYNLDLGQIPWYLLDALTEIPLVDTVTLQSANGTDPIHEIDVSYTWAEDNTCLALASISFQLDDASTNGSCCEVWDPPCLAPCAVVSGTTDTTPLVANAYYVMSGQNAYVQYVGGGFTSPVACNGLVTGTRGYPDSYWTGSSWEPVAELSVTPTGDDIFVSAVIMHRYYGTLQYTIDGGTTWVDVAGPFNEDEWASGITTTVPTGAVVRMEVVIGACMLGNSESYFVRCDLPGMMSFAFSTGSGYLYAETDTGYFALRASDGSITVGVADESTTPSPNSYCLWSSDASGMQSGSLTALYLSSTAITTIDVSANTALTIFELSSTAITTIDVSANTALTTLDLSSTAITTIDVSANTALTILDLSSTAITTIDVSANTALTYLGLNSTPITSIDLSSNTALTALDLSSTAITTIDVSANTVLTALVLSSIAITTIDISANTALTDLYLSSCTSLISLDAHGLIHINSLFITGCSSLNSINLSGCALSQSLLNDTLVTLDGLGRSDVVANFSGGTTPHPTSTGLTAYNNLIAKGCTITVN